MRDISFISFGVPVSLAVPESAAWDAALTWILPPGWIPATDSPTRHTLRVDPGVDGYIVTDLTDKKTLPLSEDDAAALVERRIRERVALHAPNHIFIHAGVVEVGGKAIVIPGHTHTGKTTLVQALLAAGCGYLSDEYAAVDADGMVHPYPRPLSVRRPDGTRDRVIVNHNASVDAPVPPTAVVTLPRRPDEPLMLRRGRPGPAAMALMNNTIPARVRPAESLRSAATLARRTTYWRGHRRDADEAARALLDHLVE